MIYTAPELADMHFLKGQECAIYVFESQVAAVAVVSISIMYFIILNKSLNLVL